MSKLDFIIAKIHTIQSIGRLVAYWKFKNKKIVFTNGCFDIIHLGHIIYLAKAADMGDKLIIGVNSDHSIKRLKGKNRPINDEKARQYVLASLSFVSAVVLFEEDTPLSLIQTIKPDILVKGADYKPEDISGYDFVKSYGGITKCIDLVEGYSTTIIEKKIKETY
ncbi:MAG TPA: D-glycero-beta-D-manno-heptose 1-phosphate adenylyltransferase [Bacteroidales bacterium]|nr:D-glycero-beta-D-manno-heptose 1-phosphate adenylyltransferase [Bacteroidales bacterium]